MTVLQLSALLLLCGAAVSADKWGSSHLITLVTEFDGNIFKFNMSNKQIQRIPVSDRGQGPEAIEYDPITGQIYWTNIRSDKIKRADLDGRNEQTIKSLVETPRGIALDYWTRELFYTEEKIDIVGRINLTTLRSSTIVNTRMDRPLAITLNMEKKIVYWSDIGSPPKIEQVYYSGTNRKTLVTTGLKWPIALALDETKQNLFWCDGSIKKIQYINLATMKRTVVIYKTSTHYYDLNYFDGTIYFVDLLKRNVFHSISPKGGDVTTYTLGRTMSKWRKIRIFRYYDCLTDWWGTNCSETCGHCKAGGQCNKLNGYCSAGCEIGYQAKTCKDVCPVGKYGPGCNSTCGNCHDQDTCDHVSGMCKYGCAAGWDGKFCVDECATGTHGRKCSTTCGKCLDGAPCDKVTGNCSEGCDPGWRGPRCDNECVNGTFGVKCQYFCQCWDGTVCHKLTGECPAEPVVKRACPDDRYGSICNDTCGHCRGGQSCNEADGQCEFGCDPGWSGQLCKKECGQGYYGRNCAEPCRCQMGELCDHVSGRCYKSKHGGAQKIVAPGPHDDTPVTAGLSVMVVVLAILLAVAVFFVYRKREKRPTYTDGFFNPNFTNVEPAVGVSNGQSPKVTVGEIAS